MPPNAITSVFNPCAATFTSGSSAHRDTIHRIHRFATRELHIVSVDLALVTSARPLVAMPDQTVGYRTFANSEEAKTYYRNILTNYTRRQDTNAYEFHNILSLVERGHPNAEEKLAGGVTAIQIRERRVDGRSSACFHLIKADGRVDDVSYLKCVQGLFPDEVVEEETKKAE